MPEISRFFGIIIRMFVDAGGQHHMPHFHAYYQDHVGIYDIGRIERLAGSLPRRQERLVLGLGGASPRRVDVELADVATGPTAH
jgi:hypothetical protein